MSGERDTSRRSHVTSDTDTIREWGETHEMVPVRYEEGGETNLRFVSESAVEDRHTRLDWNEFDEHARENDMVVVRHGDEGDFEVMDRAEMASHAAISDREVEESLLEGETVESKFTERSVVERTIVEEVTVESEVTDREMVESNTVDVEMISREVQDCEVTNVDTTDMGMDALNSFGSGTRSEIDCDVEVTLDEAWTVTKENTERITIESRVVETDVEETETLETDTMRETVDLEGVERTVLEGELVASPDAAERAVEAGHVESQFRDDDVIETHLFRTQMIEEDLSIRRLISGTLSDAETLASETISHAVVESDIVEPGEYDRELVVEDTTGGTATTTDTETAATDERMDTETTTDERMDTESSEAAKREPTEDDVGKTVVNASGDEVGMVASVESGQMYVDPHPSITDRIRTALGWGGEEDEDTYPVDDEHVARIENDEVVLGVDRQA